MQPPSTLLLSAGEIARMCNVSKELLIHYDKVGLLKPKVIGKNGYRYYSLKRLLPCRRHSVLPRYGHVHERGEDLSR